MTGKRLKENEKLLVQLKETCASESQTYTLVPIESETQYSHPEPFEASQIALADINANTQASKFEKLEIIGSGAMGTVWKARETSSGKIFAVKYINSDFAQNPLAVRRFEQEARLSIDLNHPNLVAVFASGIESTGEPYIQMQHIEGVSLADLISEEGKLEPERARDIFNQICEGLKYLHAHGIIHRDIKPSNIILSKTESGADLVSITDFGIAKSLYTDSQPTHALTQSVDVLGSLLYASPEQCLGEEQTAQSDIYSLGCVLFEMLSGQPPFLESNSVKLIVRQLTELPNFEKLPVDFRLLCTMCLTKEKKFRLKTVEQLLDMEKKYKVTGSFFWVPGARVASLVYGVYCLSFATTLNYQPHLVLFSSTQLVAWFVVIAANRSSSIFTAEQKRIETVLLATIPSIWLLHLLTQPDRSNTGLALVASWIAFFFTVRLIEQNNFYEKVLCSIVDFCNGKFLANVGTKLLNPVNRGIVCITAATSAWYALESILIFHSIPDLNFGALQFALGNFVGMILLTLSYSTYVCVMGAFDKGFKSNFLKAIKFTSLSFLAFLTPLLTATLFFWTPASTAIMKQSFASVSRGPTDAMNLSNDELGNYARVLTANRLIIHDQQLDLANQYVESVIKSETKPSAARTSAYALKAELAMKKNKKGVEDLFEKSIDDLYNTNLKETISNPKTFVADLMSKKQISDLAADTVDNIGFLSLKKKDIVLAEKALKCKEVKKIPNYSSNWSLKKAIESAKEKRQKQQSK